MRIEHRLADRAKGKNPSPIRELMKYMKIEGMISLGGGYPNPETFVFDRVYVEFKSGQKITMDGRNVLSASQYGPSEGQSELRRELVQWQWHKDGVQLEESQLVVLNGSQEGLFIMAYLFLNPDDAVVVSEPCYPGAISAFSSFSKHFIAIPLDEHGLNTDILEQTLATRKKQGESMPKFIYDIPNGHNPGGVAISNDRREQLIRIADRYDVMILEDDPYQLIKLEDTPLQRTLQSLDTQGRVLRLDSFSKIFAPGLRIGYASGSPELIRQFVLFKQSSNLHTSSFIQEILCQYIRATGYDHFRAHIAKNCELYRNNRDAMVAAVRKYLPADVTYNIPKEGMFIWFELPDRCDAQRMIERHGENLKVILVPGNAFSTQNGCANCMRASFSLVTPEQIEEGIRRFAEMIRRQMND